MIDTELNLKIQGGFFTKLINYDINVLLKVSITNHCIILMPDEEQEGNLKEKMKNETGKSIKYELNQINIDTRMLFAVRLSDSKLHPKDVTFQNVLEYVIEDESSINKKEKVYLSLFALDFDNSNMRHQICDKEYDSKLRVLTFEMEYALAKEMENYFNLYFQTNQDPNTTNETIKNSKYLIVTNPVGGPKDCHIKYKNITLPMLKLAKIEVDYHETTYLHHGEELVKTVPNILQYDVVVMNGGDGMIYEGLNGLLNREDNKEAKNVTLAMLPGGSGCGLATSIGLSNFAAASFSLIRSKVSKMDIFAVYSTKEQKIPRFGILDLAFGFLTDVDQVSDKFRFLGKARVDISAFFLCLANRKYNLKCYYKYEKPISTINEDISNEILLLPENVLGRDYTKDNTWSILQQKCFLLCIVNVPWPAFNFKVASKVTYNSNTLALVKDKDPKRSFTKNISTFIKEDENPGTGHATSLFDEKSITSVVITSQNKGEMLPSCRVDGETFPRSEAYQVSVIPGLINFIVPANVF